MDDQQLEQFIRRTHMRFSDHALLLQSFTHRSFVNENPGVSIGHNERLEFLGDAVLELIVTEYLFAKFPEKPEGELTNYRAALVNADMLAQVAHELGFNDFIQLSRGEAKDTGRARDYILANAFEAVVGAIYLDQGYGSSRDFIHEFLLPHIDHVIEHKLWKDPKSAFQEAAQEFVGITPTYRVMHESGPDHDKQFVVGVYVGRDLIAEGEGASKQEAEISAARAGLQVKGW